MTTQRSLWPLVAVLLAGLPLGLLAYALAIRRSQSAGIAPTDRVLQRFDEANSPAAIESPVQSSPVAHPVEPVAPPLEGAEPVHVPDHAA
ncbi:MAG: hypothetical protein KGL35_18600, partial [Bradyrhizobium sp.]|nr:hypothetical protein [Bradyrhizobium sp.]